MKQTRQEKLETVLAIACREWKTGAFARALDLLDLAQAADPDNMLLLWYRCACLEQMGRHDQVLAAIEEKTGALEECEEKMPADDDSAETEEELHEPDAALADESFFRKTLAVMPMEVCGRLLPWLDVRKTVMVYSHLLGLHPDHPDAAQWYAGRAEAYEYLAWHVSSAVADEDVVVDLAGIRYGRPELEKAAQDYLETAKRVVSNTFVYLVRAGKVLHRLKRYDEALRCYDQALACMDSDDPARSVVELHRRRSGNQGRGEHDEVADMLALAMSGNPANADRDVAGDMTYALLKSMEEAVRGGQSLTDAMGWVSDDPDDLIALMVARNIVGEAFRPVTVMDEIELEDLPVYQRKYLRATIDRLQAAECTLLAVVEVKSLTITLGQRVGVALLIAGDGTIGISVYILKPKWAGWRAFLVMLLTGRWRTCPVVEIGSTFYNGHCVTTLRSPVQALLEYGPQFHIEHVPPGMTPEKMLQAHRNRLKAFTQQYPSTYLLGARTVPEAAALVDRVNDTRLAYRRSIGYVTEQELKKILQKNYERLAGKVRARVVELATLKEAEQRDSASPASAV